MQHNEPKYYRYKGGYDNVTRCEDCNRLGLYEDQHPVNPCIDCGGEIHEYKAMKWDKDTSRWYGRDESPPIARPPRPSEETVKILQEARTNARENINKIENVQTKVFICCMVSFIIGFILGKI